MKNTDNSNKKNKKIIHLYPIMIFAIIICVVLSFVMFFYNVYIAVAGIISIAIMLIISIFKNKIEFRKLENYVLSIEKKLSVNNQDGELKNFPLPVLLFDNTDKIIWYNTLFKREFISDSAAAKISFGTSVGIKKKTEDTFISRTLNNHTVLSTYTNTSFEEEIPKVSNLYNWIRNYVHNIDGDYSNTESIAEMLKKVENDEKMKRFYLQMIAKADFNIIDFHYEETPKVYSEKERKLILENTSIPEQIKENILNGKNQDIIFTSKAGANSFDLKINDQSSGTLMFLRRLRLLYDMVTENHVYFLDEPESDLHYDLFLFYINTFIYNSEKTQLIMSSHLTSLLAEDLINDQRDLIYFVEKDSDTASSSCKRADKFGLHKNQSLYNAYKTGKFGAKPALGSPFILND